MAKVGAVGWGVTRLWGGAMRKHTPERASAIKKMGRSGAMNDPMRAQAAMSRLNPAERRALLDMTAQQQETTGEPMNREQRRRLEKARRDAQRRGRYRPRNSATASAPTPSPRPVNPTPSPVLPPTPTCPPS